MTIIILKRSLILRRVEGMYTIKNEFAKLLQKDYREINHSVTKNEIGMVGH